MAGQTQTNGQFNPYLSNAQQDLLVAALASNNPPSKHKNFCIPQNSGIKRSDSDPSNQVDLDSLSHVNAAMLDGNLDQGRPSGEFQNFDFEDTSPYLDYIDGDTSFGFDSNDLGGQMFGNLPGAQTDSSEGDKPDKRKSPEDAEDDDEEGDAKRREGDDKTAKKPGRKPLTSEPTTKRKAQNRAAQRAFRERKEKHLKDLETKVESLSKAQEADKHENGILRAQVERLQAELKDYKKRMSMSSTGISQSPPNPSRFGSRSNSNPQSDFQFDFAKFGGLPGSQLFGQTGTGTQQSFSSIQPKRESGISPKANPSTQNASPATQTANSMGRSLPSNNTSRTGSVNGTSNVNGNNNVNGFHSTLPQMQATDGLEGLFSPSILNGTVPFFESPKPTGDNSNGDNGTDSNSGIARAFRFNSGSTSSNTASPSCSSQSQYNAASSCSTTPESSHESPSQDNNKQITNGLNGKTSNAQSMNTNGVSPNNVPNFDWFATQNGGQFDPVLFGDYRESQDAIVGDGDFNSGFFNEALPYDFGSPLNFSDFAPHKAQGQSTPASQNFLAQVEKAREGGDDDDGLDQAIQQQQQPNNQQNGGEMALSKAEKMLNCNTIWSQLQSNRDFQDGKFDLDGLCSELRAKAKCSESGVTVPSEYVDAAFKKLSGNEKEAPAYDAHHDYNMKNNIDYLFQQDSVNEALRKLGG